jgi:hypothetical protein
VTFLKRTYHQGKSNQGVLWSVLLLLVLYVVGTTEVESIHGLLHDSGDETVLHSVVNERDACHQSIYHNKTDQDCGHKSHIVESNKCPLCQLTVQSAQILTKSEVVELACTTHVGSGLLPILLDGSSSALIPARAPPVNS